MQIGSESKQIDIEKLKNLLSYHPADSEREGGKSRHKEWNQLVLEFVVNATAYIDNEQDFLTFLFQMQVIRMLGNQTITNNALGIHSSDIYVDNYGDLTC